MTTRDFTREETNTMNSITMPVTVERAQVRDTRAVSQMIPFLLAMALVTAATVLSIVISGPMH